MLKLNRLLLAKEDVESGGGIATDGSVVGEHTTAEIVSEEIQKNQDKASETPVEDSSEAIDFNDFLAKKDEAPVKEAKVVKTDDTKVKTEDKTTSKVEDPKKTEEVKTTEKAKTTSTLPTDKTISRDYTGIPEASVPLFKKMSNEAFNVMKPMFLEAEANKAKLTELETQLAAKPKDANQLPDNYFEHPNGFILSPEYVQAARVAEEATLIANHWREQVDAVRNGATEFVPLQRNATTKQVELAPVAKVDQRTLSQLEQYFTNSNIQAAQFNGKVEVVQQQFHQRHTQALADLKAYESQTFKAFEDPKNGMAPIVADTLAKMNPAFRSNPMASLCAKAIVASTFLAQKLQEAQAQLKTGGATTVQAKVAAAAAKAGPTSSGAAAAADSNEDEVTMDDFEKVKNS